MNQVERRALASMLGIGVLVSNHKNAVKYVKSMTNILPHLEGAKVSFILNGRDYENPENVKELISLVPAGVELVHNDPIPYDVVKKEYFSQAGDLSSFKFLKMRQLCVDQMLDKKYWFVMDDDMTFGGATANTRASAGLMLLRAVAYMENHPKCGVITGGSTMIKKLTPSQIGIYNKPCWMARGLLLRNVDNLIVDSGAMDSAGGGEDVVLWYDRIHKGYYCGVMPHFRVTHHHYDKKYGEDSEVGKAEWHMEQVRQHPTYGAETKLREIYGIEYNYCQTTHQQWTSYIEGKLRERFGCDTFGPEYTEDMSHIE